MKYRILENENGKFRAQREIEIGLWKDTLSELDGSRKKVPLTYATYDLAYEAIMESHDDHLRDKRAGNWTVRQELDMPE